MCGLSFEEVERLLPQGPPILMVDRVLAYTLGREIAAIKCVSGSDPFLHGHMREGPRIVPGLLLIEGIGQCALLLFLLERGIVQVPTLTHLLGGVKASFRGIVKPGDVIHYHVRIEAMTSSRAQFTGTAAVDEKIVVKAECFSVGAHLGDVQR